MAFFPDAAEFPRPFGLDEAKLVFHLLGRGLETALQFQHALVRQFWRPRRQPSLSATTASNTACFSTRSLNTARSFSGGN